MIKKHIAKSIGQVARLRVEASTVPSRLKKQKTPDQAYQALFHDIQTAQLHADSKTFVDAVPLARRRAILRAYDKARHDPNFDLMQFVAQNFMTADEHAAFTEPSTNHDMSEHISLLWDGLRREALKTSGSLIAVPYPYEVPGGRFNELFYWDSYFIAIGLAADDRMDEVEGILRNFAYMIRRFGYIPTANRTYLTSRSQPPFFAHLARLVATYKGRRVLVRYLPYLLAEYRFWMRGSSKLRKGGLLAYRRVVRMPDGTILNRYFDDETAPRPESYPEDLETAEHAAERQSTQVYLDVRAAAESGWDFSSRWLRDGRSLSTIHTTELVPVDLNSLLYQLEMTIAEAYKALRQTMLRDRFMQAAEHRAAAIRKYCWNDEKGFFYDFDSVTGTLSPHTTLAGVFPLYARIATDDQAALVATQLERQFLQAGGLVTSLSNSGQQWDAPNGWAPLQLVAITGLRRYGHESLADEVKRRWLMCNQLIFNDRHKMVEKYDVMHPGAVAGGGEYVLQDGFGWTNGVAQALMKEDETLRRAITEV